VPRLPRANPASRGVAARRTDAAASGAAPQPSTMATPRRVDPSALRRGAAPGPRVLGRVAPCAAIPAPRLRAHPGAL